LPESNTSEHAQADGEGFLALEGARDAGACEDDGGEEGELDAVGLAVADAEATEAVL